MLGNAVTNSPPPYQGYGRSHSYPQQQQQHPQQVVVGGGAEGGAGGGGVGMGVSPQLAPSPAHPGPNSLHSHSPHYPIAYGGQECTMIVTNRISYFICTDKFHLLIFLSS